MKKFLFLILNLCLVFSTDLYSQVLNDSGQHGTMVIQTKKGPADNTLDGSPYETEAFQKGKIITTGKDPLIVFLRYDVLNDEMEIKTEQQAQDIFIIPEKNNTEYSIGDTNYIFETFQHDGERLHGYFKEYYDGKNVRLLKRMTTTITEPVKAQTGYQKDRPARIIIQEKYYLAFGDGKIEEVRLREKDFKKALPNSKAASKYFSDNKVRNLEDYIQMLKWYDQQ